MSGPRAMPHAQDSIEAKGQGRMFNLAQLITLLARRGSTRSDGLRENPPPPQTATCHVAAFPDSTSVTWNEVSHRGVPSFGSITI